MCGTGDMFCFGLMNNANLITDMLDNQDSYNVISVEVGRVWLELPSPIILLNQIQAVLGNLIQLGL